MRPRLEVTLLALVPALIAGAAEPARDGGEARPLFDASFGDRKQPITVTADTLEYDYKTNVVVYRGDVVATQGEMKVRSDTLTVTFAAARDGGGAPTTDKSGQRLEQIVAVGNVRIDNGTRWATGGRAVFQQDARTLVLTETPVLHDGPNEVAGDRVVVYLDENRSVVEGGRKRVKAVVFPGKEDGLAPARKAKDGTPNGAPANAPDAAARAATP